MYDNIKLMLYVNTLSNYDAKVLADLKKRFSMNNQDLVKGTANNAGYQMLPQNKNIYISYVPFNGTCSEHFIIQFSLHKVYNQVTHNNSQNYDKFTIKQAKEAFCLVIDMFLNHVGLDISTAKVVEFEVGVNVQVADSPETYMQELSHVEVGKKEIRITDNPKVKEFKMFCSNSSIKKKIVYTFYDKTAEILHKNAAAKDVPQNILRVEKDYKRREGIYFDDRNETDLFNDTFIALIVADFYNSFVNNLRFKESPIIQGNSMNAKTIQVFNLVKEFGKVGVYSEIERQRKEGLIGKMYYHRLKQKIDEFLNSDFKEKVAESEKIKSFKNLLLQEINDLK